MATEKGALLVTLLALSMPWWWQPSQCDNAQHVVHIGRAAIHGLTTTVGDKSVRKYLGIRYAQPPTGLRRFQPPVPAELPVEVDASRYGARCPQLPLTNTAMSEDCLFLNVFAPHLPSGRRVPVLVWLHGGGFITGASDIYQGDVLAAEGRVVVVTLNYRLGALGFLSTGDNSSLGNYGLWDQRLALQWVQQHIRHFGGDERRVTLAGVSAGAASASIHSLTPLSRDLFRHVVQVSGSAASPWARVSASAALRAARALGQRLGCQTERYNISTQSMVRCIRGQRLDHLVTSSAVLFPRQVALSLVDYTWAPVTDGLLVTDITTATAFPGPLLAGLVSNEGACLTNWTVPRVSRYILDTQELLTQRPFYRQQLLPTLLKQAYPTLVPAAHPSRGAREEAWRRPPYPRALRSLECAYLGDEGPGQRTVHDWQLRQLFGDQAFVWGTLRYLQQFATYQPSFLYYMDHQTERPGVEGMRHVDDMAFLFGFNSSIADILGFRGHVTDLDLQLARDFRRLIFNFMKTGGTAPAPLVPASPLPATPRAHSASRPRPQRSTGSDVTSLVGCHPKGTLHSADDPNSPSRSLGWPLWSPYTPHGAYFLLLAPRPALRSHLKARKMALWAQELPLLLTSSGNASARWQCVTAASSGHLHFHTVSSYGCALFVSTLLLLVNGGQS